MGITFLSFFFFLREGNNLFWENFGSEATTVNYEFVGCNRKLISSSSVKGEKR
jgi:hypothetical protein